MAFISHGLAYTLVSSLFSAHPTHPPSSHPTPRRAILYTADVLTSTFNGYADLLLRRSSLRTLWLLRR